MDKQLAAQLLDAWQVLDRAVKAIETASVSNLGQRVEAMMKARAEMDEQVMVSAREIAKVAG